MRSAYKYRFIVFFHKSRIKLTEIMFSKRYFSVLLWIVFLEVQVECPHSPKESEPDPCAISSKKGLIHKMGGLFRKKNTDNDLMNIGREREAKGQLQEALMCYDKAIKKNPLDASHFSTRAKLRKKLQNIPGAIEDLTEVIKLAPQNVQDRISLSELLIEENKFSEAIYVVLVLGDTGLCDLGKKIFLKKDYEMAARCFSEAIVKNKTEVSYYIMRGDCYAELGDLDRAIKDYKEVRSRDSKNYSGHARLTEVLFNAGKYPDLIKETIDLDDPEELGKLAKKFFAEKMFNEALSCYDVAIEKNKSEVSYYVMRGDCHIELNNFVAALEDYRAVRGIDPQNNRGHVHLTEAFLKAEKYEELIQETIALDDHKELAELGKTFYYKNKFDEAIRCFDEAITRNDTVANYYRLRRDCHLKKENLDLAIADCRNAISNLEDDQKLDERILLIRILLQFEKSDEVKKELSQMSDIEVEKASKKLLLSRKYKEAIHYYTEAIGRKSDNAVNYGNRGTCYVQLDEFQLAAADFENAVNLAGNRLDYRIDWRNALFKAGRIKDAIDVTIAFDDEGTYLMALGGELFAMENYDDAITCYNEAINKNPETHHYWYFVKRGICHTRMNNYDAAILDFYKAVTNVAQTHSCRVLLTEALLHVGRFDDATEQMKELEDIQLFELTSEFFDKGELEQALQCNNEIMRRQPTDEVFYRLRGNILRGLGKLNDAKEIIEQALKDRPNSSGCWLDLGEISFEANDHDAVENALGKIDKKKLNAEDSRRLETLLEKMGLSEKGTEKTEEQSVKLNEEADKQQEKKIKEEEVDKQQSEILKEERSEEPRSGKLKEETDEQRGENLKEEETDTQRREKLEETERKHQQSEKLKEEEIDEQRKEKSEEDGIAKVKLTGESNEGIEKKGEK